MILRFRDFYGARYSLKLLAISYQILMVRPPAAIIARLYIFSSLPVKPPARRAQPFSLSF